MKTYRHKTTGIKVSNKPFWGFYLSEGFTVEDLLKNSRDWEEVIDKDYRILSWKYKNSVFSILNLKSTKTKIYCDKGTWITPRQAEQVVSVKIQSIQRLSDGKIFTVGDRVRHATRRELTSVIGKFYINEEGSCLIHSNSEEKPFFSEVIKYVDKIEKLFTTEDGVDIFEGDEFYWLCSNARKGTTEAGSPRHKKFSTEKAAKEYVLRNKPLLSLKDIFSVYPEFKKDSQELTKHAEDLIHLVKRNEIF